MSSSLDFSKFGTSMHRHLANSYINLELKGEATAEDKPGLHQFIDVN